MKPGIDQFQKFVVFEIQKKDQYFFQTRYILEKFGYVLTSTGVYLLVYHV